MWEWFYENIIGGIICVVGGFFFFIVYIHLLGVLEPILAIVIGIPFWLAILVGIGHIFYHLYHFIVSIFKPDKYRKPL